MKEFNDPVFSDEPGYWSAVRLGDVREAARRFGRCGMRDVRLLPDWLLGLTFADPLIGAEVRLEIEPFKDGRPGWYWYEIIHADSWSLGGPMGPGRTVLVLPWPRQVVRAYFSETWYERRPPHRKVR